jgi:hypothetical protein
LGAETLTTWTCDRCGAQVVTTENEPPKGWGYLTNTVGMLTYDWLLCDKCWDDFTERFMSNKAVEPHQP